MIDPVLTAGFFSSGRTVRMSAYFRSPYIVHMQDKLKNPDLGMLFIRIGIAAVFFFHGMTKLEHMAGTIAFFGHLGLPPAMAWFIAILETVGGLAVLLGLYTHIFGALLAADMLGAIFLAKFGMGFIGGYEFEFMLFVASTALIVLGPGRYAIAMPAKRPEKASAPDTAPDAPKTE